MKRIENLNRAETIPGARPVAKEIQDLAMYRAAQIPKFRNVFDIGVLRSLDSLNPSGRESSRSSDRDRPINSGPNLSSSSLTITNKGAGMMCPNCQRCMTLDGNEIRDIHNLEGKYTKEKEKREIFINI